MQFYIISDIIFKHNSDELEIIKILCINSQKMIKCSKYYRIFQRV